MNTSIGGYFELELHKGEHYHKNAIRLNSAHNCFEYILKARQYTHVYIPYYTCYIMFDVLKKQNVSFTPYHINNDFDPVELPELKKGEAFVYTNYYGVKGTTVKYLAKKYGDRLIVDNAQSFFSKAIDGVDTFYSPRKFFGVPDGGYLYTDVKLNDEFPVAKIGDCMSHLIRRIEYGADIGYIDFQKNEKSLCERPIERMSSISDALLKSIDYDEARSIRRHNYKMLDEKLRSSNRLHLHIEENVVPMVYPYFSEKEGLRDFLISNKIYVAKYWPIIDEICNKKDVEYSLWNCLIPLPIDQRYGENEMSYIIDMICKFQLDR